ncbi:MAG: hypothetical protein AB8B91_13725 [Rubripirellula sp.]
MTDSSHQRESVETIIRAAGDYVQPSDDLRPRTLQAARDLCGDRRAERKLGGLVIAILVVAFISSPVTQYVQALRSQTAPTSSAEMQERALVYSEQPGVGSNWAMAEAFSQLRRAQASKIAFAR